MTTFTIPSPSVYSRSELAPTPVPLRRPRARATAPAKGTDGDAEIDPSTRNSAVELTTRHSLAWLTLANAVGVLLASLLLVPALGEALGRLSYGRLMPLHLDLQLYGWCALPLVAFLFTIYLPTGTVGRGPGLAIAAWSGSLLFASCSWLSGHSSGKLFLEWTGATRILYPAALLGLALVLARGWLRKRRRESMSVASQLFPSALLLGLFAVPFVLYWAASPTFYPPYNPNSGGATGTSLLGSTLGIIGLFCLMPLLGRAERRCSVRSIVGTFVLLTLHFAAFASLDHGYASNHELAQIIGLSSLAIWWPLLTRYYRGFDWPGNALPWLLAFAGWSGFLLITAIATFLPDVLVQWRFTNALVAHAHLAMAGMVTCFNVTILILINQGTRSRSVFDGRGSFWLWQIGCAVMVLALLVLGTLEGVDPGRLFRPDLVATVLYSVRLMAGVAMLVASALWLRRSFPHTLNGASHV